MPPRIVYCRRQVISRLSFLKSNASRSMTTIISTLPCRTCLQYRGKIDTTSSKLFATTKTARQFSNSTIVGSVSVTTLYGKPLRDSIMGAFGERPDLFESPIRFVPHTANHTDTRKSMYEQISKIHPFPRAWRWFKPAATSSTGMSHFELDPNSELLAYGYIMLPYEMVVSKDGTDLTVGLDQLEVFREYLKNGAGETKSRHPRAPNIAGFLPTVSFNDNGRSDQFVPFNAPLQLLFEASDMNHSTNSEAGSQPMAPMKGLYIAQTPFIDLPQSLKDAFPTPFAIPDPQSSLKSVGLIGQKQQSAQFGSNIYGSNIWFGLSPTYTPLHKDPHPNLFVQIAGTKLIRLCKPEIGENIFREVQENIGGRASPSVRGDEMMQSPERPALHDAVWKQWDSSENYEVEVSSGEALFIPKGWWHSIKSVGTGLNMSVNWWFR